MSPLAIKDLKLVPLHTDLDAVLIPALTDYENEVLALVLVHLYGNPTERQSTSSLLR